MFNFIRKIFSRKENAFYRSQRLACAKDLGLPETATWREIIIANNELVAFPTSLLHSSAAEITETADQIAKSTPMKNLEIALRVEKRLMALNLPARDMMLV